MRRWTTAPSGRPTRSREDVEGWARDQRLPCENGHVQFPDVRLEIEERDGRREVEDLEVVTPHYRGAHAAACTPCSHDAGEGACL